MFINKGWKCANVGGYRDAVALEQNHPCNNYSALQNCKKECTCTKKNHPQTNTLVKCVSFGGLILSENIKRGTAYNLVSINQDISQYQNFSIELNFACNVILTNSKSNLGFRIFKFWENMLTPVPIISDFLYLRNTERTEANTVSFSAYDNDSIKSNFCHYEVCVEAMGNIENSYISILNPILTMTVTDKLDCTSN